MKSSQRFFTLLKPYKGKLALVIFTNCLSVFFSIATMMLIEPFVKLIFKGETTHLSGIGEWLMSLVYLFITPSSGLHSLFGIVIFVVLLFLFKNLFYFLAQCFMAPIRSDFVCQLRNALYKKTLILPLSYFSEQKKGDIVSRAINDAQDLEFSLLVAFKQLLSDPLTVLFYLTSLFILSYKLTLCVLVLLPLAALVITSISKKLKRQSKEAQNKLGLLTAHVEESLLGLRIIKGFNAQTHAESVFEKYNHLVADLKKRILRRVDMASPMSEVLGIASVMIILVIGGVLILSGSDTLTAELFITYIALFSQIINPAKNISTAWSNYKRGLAGLDRIYEILDAEEVIVEKQNALPIKKFDNEIVFKDVTFAYEQKPVLKNINGRIAKGEVIALVGVSGSGKSTLLDLLPRFYDLTGGDILIDGISVKDFVIDDLRGLFALVSQDVVLFNESVFHNIAFGRDDVSYEAVVAAAKTANAYDFIMALPQQFDTIIGDRGLSLSGGQRQRLSIARAVLRNAPILLLDEATSAMDTESERIVQDALNKVMQNRTSIVVAHRLSTIQHADCIWVMQEGEIIEKGTHDELLHLNGKYRTLLETQNGTKTFSV